MGNKFQFQLMLPDNTQIPQPVVGKYSARLNQKQQTVTTQPPQTEAAAPAPSALEQSAAAATAAQNEYQTKLQQYKANGGNIFMQHILDNKPERDEKRERALKAVAKGGALSDLLGLVGKGISAFNGIAPKPSENKPYILSSMDQLRRMDDLYEAKNLRWNDDLLKGKMLQNKDEQDTALFGIQTAARASEQAQATHAAALKREFDKLQKQEQNEFTAGENAKNRANNTRNAQMRAANDAVGKKDKDWLFNVPDGMGGTAEITNSSLAELRMWAERHPDPQIKSLAGDLEYKSDTGGMSDAAKQSMVLRAAKLQQKKTAEDIVNDDINLFIEAGKKLSAQDALELAMTDNAAYRTVGAKRVRELYKNRGLINDNE